MDKTAYLNSVGLHPTSENMSKNLEVKCKNNHTFKRAFSNIQRGSTSCPYCESENKLILLSSLGYCVISDITKSLLTVQCKNNHTFARNWGDFNSGKVSCAGCIELNKINYLADLGYNNIKVVKNKVEVRCKNNHTFARNWGDFNSGKVSCVKCSEVSNVSFIENNYNIIEKESSDLFTLECKNKHITKRTLRDLKKQPLCLVCLNEENESYKQNEISSRGYSYINSDGSLSIVECKNNHIFSKSTSDIIRNKYHCNICIDDNKRKQLKLHGLHTTQSPIPENLELYCDKNHTFERLYSNFNKGATKCPICYPNTSSQEIEIKEFLELLEVNFIHSDWNTIKPKELDFYFPDNNLAIEFNGIYWHSELQGKTYEYHLDKTNNCNSKGIDLLHIFENEWMDLDKRKIWKCIIKGKLNLNPELNPELITREFIIRKVSNIEENEFLNKNHLQGFISSDIALGLYINDELINIMTFGEIHSGFELIRFASKLDLNVIGGASKLFEYFVNNYSNKARIISYSDRRYSNNDLYIKLGFDFKYNLAPNCFYFRGNALNIKPKRPKNKDLLEDFTPNLTEWMSMKNNGFNRIWDCGSSVWIYPNI